MIKLPFTPTVSLKNYVSGIDVTLKLENINSSMIVAANDIREIISPEMYDDIIDKMTTPPTDEDEAKKYAEVLELLRFAIVPLALYHHFIWLQIRVSPNSITTYKTDKETTAFKYQTDEARESLLISYGLFTKELIDSLDSDKETFTAWAESPQSTAFNNLLIKTYRDFDNCFQTEGNAAFFIRSRVFQQEAYDEINAHIKIKTILDATTPDPVMISKLKRALAYITVSRAISEWDNYYLPSTLRRNMANDASNNPRLTSEDVKDKLSFKYRNMAESVLRGMDIKTKADSQVPDKPSEYNPCEKRRHNENDKFVSMI